MRVARAATERKAMVSAKHEVEINGRHLPGFCRRELRQRLCHGNSDLMNLSRINDGDTEPGNAGSRFWIPSASLLAASLTLLMTISLPGCGSSSVTKERIALNGLVTQGGVPLISASLRFVPSPNRKLMSSGGAVVDGHFSIPHESGPTPGGEYQVYVEELNMPAPAKTVARKIKPVRPRQWQLNVQIPDDGSTELNLAIP